MLGVKKGALEPDAASGALGAALGHKEGGGVRGRTRVPNAARWCQEAAYAAVPVGGTCCWTPSHPLKPPLTSTTSDLAFLAVARVMGGSAGSGASSSRLCRDGTWSSSSWGGTGRDTHEPHQSPGSFVHLGADRAGSTHAVGQGHIPPKGAGTRSLTVRLRGLMTPPGGWQVSLLLTRISVG